MIVRAYSPERSNQKSDRIHLRKQPRKSVPKICKQQVKVVGMKPKHKTIKDSSIINKIETTSDFNPNDVFKVEAILKTEADHINMEQTADFSTLDNRAPDAA